MHIYIWVFASAIWRDIWYSTVVQQFYEGKLIVVIVVWCATGNCCLGIVPVGYNTSSPRVYRYPDSRSNCKSPKLFSYISRACFCDAPASCAPRAVLDSAHETRTRTPPLRGQVTWTSWRTRRARSRWPRCEAEVALNEICERCIVHSMLHISAAERGSRSLATH